MGGGASKSNSESIPSVPVPVPNNNKSDAETPRRANGKVTMFWKRKFGNSDTAPWPEFIEAYKQWMGDTFPDVLDEDEFENLMTDEAIKALKHALCGTKSKSKSAAVALPKFSAAYPTGPDLFIATKQLISRAIRQLRQDTRNIPQNNKARTDREG